jgi:hypothetical protein
MKNGGWFESILSKGLGAGETIILSISERTKSKIS